MTDAARFFQKVLQTKYSFKNEDGITVLLSNPSGLGSITVAIPKTGLRVMEQPDLKVEEDNIYYYLTVKDNDKKSIKIHLNNL